MQYFVRLLVQARTDEERERTYVKFPMILRLLHRRGMNELLLFIIDVQSNFRKNDRYRYIMFCPYSKALNAVIDRKSFYYFLK